MQKCSYSLTYLNDLLPLKALMNAAFIASYNSEPCGSSKGWQIIFSEAPPIKNRAVVIVHRTHPNNKMIELEPHKQRAPDPRDLSPNNPQQPKWNILVTTAISRNNHET